MFAVWCPPPTPPMPFGLSYEVVAMGILAQFALVANGSYLLLDHLLVRKLPTLGQWGSRILLVSTQAGLAMVGFRVTDEAILYQFWPGFEDLRWALEGTFMYLWLPLLMLGLGICLADGAFRRWGLGKTLLAGLPLIPLAWWLAGDNYYFGLDQFSWTLLAGYAALVHPCLRKLAEKFIIKPRRDIWEVPRVVPVNNN